MATKSVDDCQQLRKKLIVALGRLRAGDFSVRLQLASNNAQDRHIAELFNQVVETNESITGEFERLARVVGKEGEINQRAKVKGAGGAWKSKIDAVNALVEDMVQPTTEVARVIGAVAEGDLSHHMSVSIDGRGLRANSYASARSSTRWSTSSLPLRPR